MPKIKLSALVSDMKGKANGSVFSKNSGGIYFRNNPSGGGKKSAKWDKQKSNFSAIARAWRSLTELQQQSWIDIVNQYPTKNAFGDVRIPTGYELFCRLNGALTATQIAGDECSDDEECPEGYMCINNVCTYTAGGGSAGLPALTTPLSPRSVPSVGYVGINWSELFQLNPNKKLPLFNKNNFFSQQHFLPISLIDDTAIFSDQTFAFRFEMYKKQYVTIDINTQLLIYSFVDVNDFGFRVFVKNISTNSFQLYITSEFGTGNATYTIDVAENLFSGPFHIAFNTITVATSNLNVYVNGIERGMQKAEFGTHSNPNRSWQHRIVNSEDFGLVAFYLSDFKYFQNIINAEGVKLLSQGYFLGNELIALDCITHTGNTFTNFGTAGSSYDFVYTLFTEQNLQLENASFALIPNFEIEVENTGLFDMYVNIYATPPISWGKTGTTTNLKLLGSFYWDTETKFSVYKQYKAIYGNVPPNSNVDFYVQAIDGTTGDMLLTKTKGKKNKPRFKAGADLTEKVN